ncbi:hypothetical protein GDO81_006132 [Engystomops pustulosus]|uniref:Apoptosis antagonizing transcription factor n=1 Tax=Engystomops pustulosus TaxID=76066 RepID=A0AAV7CUQ7_ENGPU|nr:hypothetical protein GDO81_006132 [Engystomops pustulosus]
MAAPLSKELESFLNPQPQFWDPEDDPDEVTAAKVVDKYDEGGSDDDDAVKLGNIKKNAVTYLSDTDKKYLGKATSRKQLKAELGGDSFSENSDEDLSEGDDIDEKILSNEANQTEEEDDDEDEEDVNDDDEEDNEEEDDGGIYSAQQRGSEIQDDALQTFSKEKVSADVAKGQGIKNQIGYKALKELMRSLVELQDELLFQFPETRYLIDGKECKADSDEEIPSDEEMENEDMIMEKNRRPPKRKLEVKDYPGFMEKRFADFQTFRNNTLQKWHDKTKLTGKMGKGFSSSDRSILMQVEQILMDKARLLRRTQTKRSLYRILGKSQQDLAPEPEQVPDETLDAQTEGKSNSKLKELDEEIFDDDDFYHQLLRELIERKTTSLDPNDQVAMGRQWLAIQKLRSKIKRKVDTRASKGRKVRYHVHSKLVSFMAPIGHSTMNDEAR